MAMLLDESYLASQPPVKKRAKPSNLAAAPVKPTTEAPVKKTSKFNPIFEDEPVPEPAVSDSEDVLADWMNPTKPKDKSPVPVTTTVSVDAIELPDDDFGASDFAVQYDEDDDRPEYTFYQQDEPMNYDNEPVNTEVQQNENPSCK